LIEGVDLGARIQEAQDIDEEVVKIVKEMKEAGVKMLREEEWREENGILLKEGKVYVPKEEKL
jgi:hypothetical protein